MTRDDNGPRGPRGPRNPHGPRNSGSGRDESGKRPGAPKGRSGGRPDDRIADKDARPARRGKPGDRPERGPRPERSPRPDRGFSSSAEKRPERNRFDRNKPDHDDRPQRRDQEEKGSREDRSPTAPTVPGQETRAAAVDILTLLHKGRTFDEALEQCRSFDALEGADRGFARAMATIAVRRRGTLDHLIGAYIDRPLPKRAARVMDILRVAGAQLIFLGTPDHAAVSTATALTKSFRETEGYAGLVNAIARKLVKSKDAAPDLPVRIDTPGWLWRSWERAYGAAIARDIALAHRDEPPIDLTVKNDADATALAETLSAKIVGADSLRFRPTEPLTTLPGFADGKWWVQDAAAKLPALLLGDIKGKTVFDLCAAPGGKTMQLAASGAKVTAVDASGPRLKIVQENLRRVGLSAETVKADATDWTPERKADAILLDAPCSATGTVRRHPDILWSKTEDDVAALAKLQSALIDHAVTLLKPGGVLVYCVCSLQPEEGEKQAAAALKRHKGLARLPIEPEEIGGIPAINRDGDLRTLPSMLAKEGGMDGFFAARFSLKG